MKFARLFALILLLASAARTSADVFTINFSGDLPFDYSAAGLSQFSNTSVSGSFTYDTATGIYPGNWGEPNVTGIGNVAFNIQFSNGYHADFTGALRDYSPWANTGSDLLVATGPMVVFNGVYFGNSALTNVNLLDGSNTQTGVQLKGLSFLMPHDLQNFRTGFSGSNITGGVTLNNAGISMFNTRISTVPDAAGTFGLLGLGMLGLVAVRRRLGAR